MTILYMCLTGTLKSISGEATAARATVTAYGIRTRGIVITIMASSAALFNIYTQDDQDSTSAHVPHTTCHTVVLHSLNKEQIILKRAYNDVH